MPAGTTWPQYLKFFTAAMLSMLAGAQVVHSYYKPLQDLDKYIEKEFENTKSVEKINVMINK